MSHSESTTKSDGWGASAPLRRFLEERKQRNGDTTNTISTTDASGLHEAATRRSNDCTQRSTRCSQWARTSDSNNSKPSHKSKHSKRSGTGKSHRSSSKKHENNSIPRLEGFCRCGRPVAPYDIDRCENCFAVDSEIFSGKPQQVVLRW